MTLDISVTRVAQNAVSLRHSRLAVEIAAICNGPSTSSD
jgi:hypothetical protein